MRVTYYALRQVKVGDDVREAGDLVPEAAKWAALSGYVQDGWLAPVLVATLPEDVQKVLLDWEAAQQQPATGDNDPGEDDSGDEVPAPDDKAQTAPARKGRSAA